ncbi:hypothetical protein BDP27DRAFT_1334680 [Rhodocollybia butyracea]|uniref:Uncharacterized protein n=1 Tax=Rhodocollybia butyracea TaxID=206335 RepID=A0A9P5PHW2_9AGAR|nr:hypothetical protein BDP27DRAFT_1334680 [Rhodocollybia butyracea]
MITTTLYHVSKCLFCVLVFFFEDEQHIRPVPMFVRTNIYCLLFLNFFIALPASIGTSC